MGFEETLVVVRYEERGRLKYDYHLSNADRGTPLEEVARVAKAGHRIEECLKRGKSEAGLGDYQVRNWLGWHHHMTLSLLALWFLQLERLRLGGKNPGCDGVASAGDLHRTAPEAASDGGGDRQRGQRCAAA